MREVIPGIFHWTAIHPSTGSRASSYFVAPAAAVIDPLLPDGGVAALPGRPEQVLLTSGHHLRDAPQIADELGIPIRALPQAVEYVAAEAAVDPIPAGQEAAPGIVPVHVGVISEDECALEIRHGEGTLAVADGVNHTREELGFFPDRLLGDDPEGVKRGLKRRFAEILDAYDFQALLFAHGEPLPEGGAEALRAFVNG